MAFGNVTPRFFARPADLRRWFERHHQTAPELWVGMYKKASGKPSITWPEVVDEALCFGWIDGIRKGLDRDSYANRLTPRRKGSNWSLINIRRVAVLKREGRMHAAGLAAFSARDERKSGVYSFEQKDVARFESSLLETFRADTRAWTSFESQPPGYRKVATFWVMSAKQATTRTRRLGRLMDDHRAGRRLGMLARPEKKS
jgi:uncharacterized protein YdeI (YjbR/CyaY-like superfamily)